MGRVRPLPELRPLLSADGHVDADQLHAVMELLDWRWANRVPSTAEIVAMVRSLVEEIACDPSVASIESGGIRVSRDDAGELRACFEIDLAVARCTRPARRAVT